MKIFIKYFFVVYIFLGCDKQQIIINLNQQDLKNWQDKNILDLHECCNEFNRSGLETVMYRVFKRNVRGRVLSKLKFVKESNVVEFFESYGNNNNNLIDVFVNGKEASFFTFKIVNDTIIDRKQNAKKVLSFKDKRSAIKSLTNTSECCDLKMSHPSLLIYSKLIVRDN